jgi:hypothetical protein
VAFLTLENRRAVFDPATRELRRTFAITGSSTGGRQIVLSHTGRWLALCSPSMRGVDIYNFATGELRYTLPDREGTVYWLVAPLNRDSPSPATTATSPSGASRRLTGTDGAGLGFALRRQPSQLSRDAKIFNAKANTQKRNSLAGPWCQSGLTFGERKRAAAVPIPLYQLAPLRLCSAISNIVAFCEDFPGRSCLAAARLSTASAVTPASSTYPLRWDSRAQVCCGFAALRLALNAD